MPALTRRTNAGAPLHPSSSAALLLAPTRSRHTFAPTRTHAARTRTFSRILPRSLARSPYLEPRSPPLARPGPPSGDVSRACSNGSGASRPPLPEARAPRGAAREGRTHAGELGTGH